MQYDPIKRSLGNVFNQTPFLRILFYRLLDLLLLRAWHIHRALKQWKKEQKGAKTILDAGSGFGQYVYTMSVMSRKWKIKGVDVKGEQVADCNRFFSQIGKEEQVRFEVADLTQFNEPDIYDLILSVDVMEHIEKDELVFQNFHKAMKPGGMLLISTPSDQGGSDTHHHHEDEVTGFIDEHVRDGYGIEDITQKLKRAGFTSIQANYTYGKPGRLSWKLSMKWPILLLNASKLFFVLLPIYYLVVYPLAFILNIFDLNGQHKSGTGLMVKAYKPSA